MIISRQFAVGEDVPTAGPLPMLGLGTWQNDDSDDCANAVATALEAGYRHVDTAQAYGKEEHVGLSLRLLRLPRTPSLRSGRVVCSHDI